MLRPPGTTPSIAKTPVSCPGTACCQYWRGGVCNARRAEKARFGVRFRLTWSTRSERGHI
eukprot:895563-Rhodomonas_salina.3